MRISLTSFVRMCTRTALLVLVGATQTQAQDAPASSAATTTMNATSPVTVFLDCGFECDGDFIRTEITYVDWVRDRVAADVHVLVTAQGTGGGGRRYTLAFIGQRRFAGIGDTLEFVSAQSSTSDDTRRGLTRTLRVGLVRFLARTPLADRLQISLAAPPAGGADAPSTAVTRDPWNFWVFSVGANGNLNGERSNSFGSLSGSASARRTTEQWKINLQARQSYNRSTFQIGDATSKFIRRSASFNQLIVRSIGPRLSAGLRSSVGSSTFENKDFSFRLTPAVEYDVFPYSESTRRSLIVQYAAGAEGFDYKDTTIYGRTEETRPLHTLVVALSQNQPWGSVNVTVEGGQYLNATYRNFASFSGGTSVRVFKGLNFNMQASFASIHNQLYIARRGATDEEILTQQRRLATNYSYFAFTGLSYTFGSVLNNVVNPRFGRGDGGKQQLFLLLSKISGTLRTTVLVA